MERDAHLNGLFDGLADEYRRIIVSTVKDAELPQSVTELSRAVLGRTEAIDDDERAVPFERIRISLRHHHLPKLAEVGLIAYDAEREQVRPTSLTEHTGRLVEMANSMVDGDGVHMDRGGCRDDTKAEG